VNSIAKIALNATNYIPRCGRTSHLPTVPIFDVSARPQQDDPLPYLQWIIAELRRTMSSDRITHNGVVFT
jgi:hypothetical protein